MASIIVVQTILPHYRASFFERLTAIDELNVKVVAGEGQEVAAFSPGSNRIRTILKNKKINIRGHVFVYQKGLLSLLWREKPDHVVFGGPDVHVLSTFWAFFVLKFLTRTKIHWWTHGINKKSRLLRAFQQFFLARSSSAMTYELEGQQDILTALNWSAEKVTVLKNAINTEDYGFNLQLSNQHEPKSTFNVLFSGRLTYSKRCDILVEAFTQILDVAPHFRLDVVGAGEAFSQCKQLADQHGITEYVTFHGELYGKKLEHIFSQSDIFVLPGKVGLSAIHALSYGLPVLTTNASVHSPEVAIIDQGVNGDFFEQFSISSLASLIITWSSKKIDKTLIQATVKEKGYTPESVVNKIVLHFKNNGV